VCQGHIEARRIMQNKNKQTKIDVIGNRKRYLPDGNFEVEYFVKFVLEYDLFNINYLLQFANVSRGKAWMDHTTR
jgi:hypothetical protein